MSFPKCRGLGIVASKLFGVPSISLLAKGSFLSCYYNDKSIPPRHWVVIGKLTINFAIERENPVGLLFDFILHALPLVENM